MKSKILIKKKYGNRPSANFQEGGKMFSVLLHPFLLSDEANSGFTPYITPLRKSLSYPHMTTKMSVLGSILFTSLNE